MTLRNALVASMLALALLPARAHALEAAISGEHLRITGPPGTALVLLGPDEKPVARGRIGPDGLLLLRGQGSADPMLRIVRVGDQRIALSALFPAVELLAVLPPALSAGLRFHPHIRVVRRAGGAATPNIDVTAALQCDKRRYPLGTLRSDAHGVAQPTAPLRVPPEAAGTCQRTLRAAGGSLAQQVKITRGATLVISTDRPVYQPGHTLHARALAIDAASGTPVRGQRGFFEIRTPDGRAIARKNATTSVFGVANASLALAVDPPPPRLEVRFVLGGATAQRSVRFGTYVPPKVLVTVAAYPPRPGQPLRARVVARRLDGGPMAGARTELTVQEPDGRTLLRTQGRCNADGVVLLEPRLASTHARTLVLRAQVWAPTGDGGNGELTVPVDDGRMQVFAIPESGRLVPRLWNGLWVVVQGTDGQPVRADVSAGDASGRTDDQGIAYLRVRPFGASAVRVHARAEKRTAEVEVQPDRGAAALLQVAPSVVGADRRVSVTFRARGGDGVALVDLVQGDHTVQSHTLPLRQGTGRLELTLPKHVGGTLRLHAWTLDKAGTAIGDTRLVIAQDTRDLTVRLRADRATYRPQDEARLDLEVRDAAGRPAVAALGLTVVDGGLKALGLEQPGIERALARLGTRLDKRVATTPEWAASAMLLADDTRRLAILAAAADADVTLRRAEETRKPRARAARRAFEPALARRVKGLARAFGAHFGRKRRFRMPRDPAALAKTLRHADDVQDPWGRASRVRLNDIGCGQIQVTLRSAGVDGAFGSDDDIEATGTFRKPAGRTRCLSFFGVGAGGFGAHGGHRVMMRAGSGSVRRGPARLRTEFPETLAVVPELITDASGHATWRVRLADSLTRWVVQARAVSRSGGLGAAELELPVEQPFSVDASLPAVLLRRDRMEIPVAVTNRRPTARTVRVHARATGALDGEVTKEVRVQPHATVVVVLPVHAGSVGAGTIEMSARGGGDEDRVRRTLVVAPDGVPDERSTSGAVMAGRPVTAELTVPEGGIPGTQRALLKIYGSAVSTAVEGLEALLASPSGCFEQTSATTYPNALVLDYLRATRRSSPEVTARARALLDQGWKRLMSYEVSGGGFSWFGEKPANRVLTAFGIMEFEQMRRSRALPGADAVIARTRQWLVSQRNPDGSFEPDAAYLHRESWGDVQKARLPVTAYIVWALARAGHLRDVRPSVRWLERHAGDAGRPFERVMLAAALSAAAPTGGAGRTARDALLRSARRADGMLEWAATGQTHSHATGRSAGVELGSLATLAFTAAGDADSAGRALGWIVRQRSPRGGWGTTQATVLALEALLAVERANQAPATGTVQVTVGDRPAQTLRFTEGDFDVIRTLALPTTAGTQRVTLELTGAGSLTWQLAALRHVPEAPPRSDAPLRLSLTPDRREVAVGGRVHVAVHLEAVGKAVAMPTVSIGIPAGFELDAGELRDPRIARHEVLGQRLVLYLKRLTAGEALDTRYDLVARRAGDVGAGAASAWPYYDPDGRIYVDGGRFRARATPGQTAAR